MRTLDRLAFDKACRFSGGEESLLDRLGDVGKQLGVFVTGTTWVTTKGVFLGMDDVILHRDNDGGLFLLTCHDRYRPFCVYVEHMFGLTAGLMMDTICGEDRADASTGTTVLNGWHSVLPHYASEHTTMLLYQQKSFTRVQELLVIECVIDITGTRYAVVKVHSLP